VSEAIDWPQLPAYYLTAEEKEKLGSAKVASRNATAIEGNNNNGGIQDTWQSRFIQSWQRLICNTGIGCSVIKTNTQRVYTLGFLDHMSWHPDNRLGTCEVRFGQFKFVERPF
jgi:hypothetical protein